MKRVEELHHPQGALAAPRAQSRVHSELGEIGVEICNVWTIRISQPQQGATAGELGQPF
jgi:hypothetical protein